MVYDNIAKTFGVATLPKIKTDVPAVDDDFNHAREKLIETIANCQTAIDQLMALADQSQAARYYEALNSTMKTMVDASKSLLDIQQQVRDINRDEAEGPRGTVHNNLFVGSSAELLTILKDVKNNKIT
jgi:hypothetical protein